MLLVAKKRVGRHKTGDIFNASHSEARVLLKMGFAEKVDEDAPKPKREAKSTYQTKVVKAEVEAPQDEGLTDLRVEYERTYGRRPFNGWDADTLRDKIATYQRRDMRAED